MKRYYAIEIIGYGKRARYCIKHVIRDGYMATVNPVDGKCYASKDAALSAAETAGITIDKVGDCYQIL